MSTEMALNFCFKKQATEDFMKMIWSLEEIKEILEEAINLNRGKYLADFIRQDIKTLENAKIAILDEKIAAQLEETIEQRKQELKKRESEKAENVEKISKVLAAYKEFESYSKMVKNMYDSVKENLSINIDKMTTEEHLAFLFAGIRFDVEESASEAYYDKAAIIYTDGNEAVKQLSETK